MEENSHTPKEEVEKASQRKDDLDKAPTVSGTVENPLSKETENSTYYQLLKGLVDTGVLDIKLVLSPPRAGSTLMETSFSKNPAIDAQIHEPFIALRKGKAEDAYKMIYEGVKPTIDAADSSKQTHVVIKEMSHWLETNNEHKRFFPLVESPPIFLIRNPLLNTESRVKKILQTLDLREKAPVQETLLNYYAKTKGVESWAAMLASYAEVPDHTVDDEAVRLYRNNQRLADLPEDPDIQPFPLQRWLLDYYAISNGHDRWKVMLKNEFDNRNYKAFGDILRDERIYGVEGAGWRATADNMKYLEDQGKHPITVDSTDYRINPEVIVPSLCEKWDIPYTEDMINWGDSNTAVNTGQTKPHQSIWYDRLQKSKGIEPPIEISPILEDFPDFIAEHLADVDLPAYVAMFNRPTRLKSEKNIVQEKLAVPVKREVYKRLRDMGILRFDMDIQGNDESDQAIFEILSQKGLLNYSHEEADSLQDAYKKRIATIDLPLQDIDPVFAYLSNPELLDDEAFRQKNHRYLPTLERIKKVQIGN
ncbi:MAG: hypothetical protein M3Q44_03650 [bacterium]|nr:hypothetical protein [bacterium]